MKTKMKLKQNDNSEWRSDWCVHGLVAMTELTCCCLWLQNLESLSFGSHGDEFISAHIDGSYTVWKLSDAARPKLEPLTPYGRFINIFLSMYLSVFSCTYLLLVIAKPKAFYLSSIFQKLHLQKLKCLLEDVSVWCECV